MLASGPEVFSQFLIADTGHLSEKKTVSICNIKISTLTWPKTIPFRGIGEEMLECQENYMLWDLQQIQGRFAVA